MTEKQEKVAFYDFQVSPFSYDFAQFILCARAANATKIVIVPGERAYQKCTPGEQEYRLNNLIMGLAPDAVRCASREEARAWWHEDCFPEGYTVDKPVASHTVAHVMKAGRIFPFVPLKDKVAEVEKDGFFGPNLVVVTIRDCHIKPERNSDVAEWVKAADWMKEQGFEVVFVPDTDKTDAVFGIHKSAPKAALDVQYRLALYALACVNVGVNNGPMALNFYSQRPMLYFKPICPAYPETSQQGWKAAGIPFRSQPPWFTPLQRVVWEGGDAAENIIATMQLWMRARKGEADVWPPSVAPDYPIRGVAGKAERAGQMTMAMAAKARHGWGMLGNVQPHKREISIVCYGPSLAKTWRYIKRPIMTVSGAHDFLVERGVIPDYHMDCDPREHKAKMLANPQRQTMYLMASVCHPSMWEKLAGHKVTLWHLHNGPETDEWLRSHDTKNSPIGGGTTAGSRAFQVAQRLGYENFHVYGMDCSYASEEVRHAGAHLGKQQKAVECMTGDGRKFISSPQMIEAAREVIVLLQNFDIGIWFHGDGLQQHMIRCLKNRFGVVEDKDEKTLHLIKQEA